MFTIMILDTLKWFELHLLFSPCFSKFEALSEPFFCSLKAPTMSILPPDLLKNSSKCLKARRTNYDTSVVLHMSSCMYK